MIEDLAGQHLADRYRMDQLLGLGGMQAPVWKATQSSTHRTVAIKLLQGTEAWPASRFEREACIAAALNHRHITTVHDYGVTDAGQLFIVMEYLGGSPLNTAMRAPAGMAVERVLHISDQLLCGLEHAHGRGVVHRDLKPDNIFLITQDDDPDFVKILDFGIAKYYQVDPDADRGDLDPGYQEVTQESVVCGTPLFMAPEQIIGDRLDHRVDIYACGLVMYRMLTGHMPFVAKGRHEVLRAQIAQAPRAFAEVAPNRSFPAGLEEVVRKALRKARSERHGSARDMRHALREFRWGLGGTTSGGMKGTGASSDLPVLLDDRWLIADVSTEESDPPPESPPVPVAERPAGEAPDADGRSSLEPQARHEPEVEPAEVAVSSVGSLPQPTQTGDDTPVERRPKRALLLPAVAALLGAAAIGAIVLATMGGGSDGEPIAAGAPALVAAPADQPKSGHAEPAPAPASAQVSNRSPVASAPADVPSVQAADAPVASARADVASVHVPDVAVASLEDATSGPDAARYEAAPLEPADAPAGTKLVTYRLTVEPEGAAVTVDGKPMGSAPLDLPLEARAHDVRVVAAGFVEAALEVDLGEAEPGTVVTESIELLKESKRGKGKRSGKRGKRPEAAKKAKPAVDAEAKPAAAKKAQIPLLGHPRKPKATIEVLK